MSIVVAVMLMVGGVSVKASAKTYLADYGKSYTLTGKVKKHKVNYDEVHKYTAYDLILSKKIKVKPNDGYVTKTKKIMIVSSDLPASAQKKIKKLAGKNKKVKITGKLVVGQTAWYCEDYAIWATKIKEVKK